MPIEIQDLQITPTAHTFPSVVPPTPAQASTPHDDSSDVAATVRRLLSTVAAHHDRMRAD